MAKTHATYWNPFDTRNDDKWETIPGTDGLLEQLTLAMQEQLQSRTSVANHDQLMFATEVAPTNTNTCMNLFSASQLVLI